MKNAVLFAAISLLVISGCNMNTPSAAPVKSASGKMLIATTPPATPATTTPSDDSTPISSPPHVWISAYGSSSPADHYYTGAAIEVPNDNQIINFKTKLMVPSEPSQSGSLFLWPGIQPNQGTHFLPLNAGVLQPVLTWGAACTPGNQPEIYSTWWISAQYVNPYGSSQGFPICQSGSIMPVKIGDTLSIEMNLKGTVWTQTITDIQSGSSVDFAIDLAGQAQNLAYFEIEGYGQHPTGEITFTDSSITFASPISKCTLNKIANSTEEVPTVVNSKPVLSDDERTCLIANLKIHDPQKNISN